MEGRELGPQGGGGHKGPPVERGTAERCIGVVWSLRLGVPMPARATNGPSDADN